MDNAGIQDELRAQWIKRVEVVGRAQARYLWILFVFGILFWTSTDKQDVIQVPFIGIKLSGAEFRATGPFIIFGLIIIIWGTLRAFRRAQNELGLQPGGTEPYDRVPNALDFFVYTLPIERSKKPWVWLRWLLKFIYPAYLTLFWLVGLNVWRRVFYPDGNVTFSLMLRVFWALGIILGIVSLAVILRFWCRRFTISS